MGERSLETDGNYIIGSEMCVRSGQPLNQNPKTVLKQRAIVPFHDTSPSLLIFMRNEIITMGPDIYNDFIRGKKYRSNFSSGMEKIYLSISKIFRREEIYITFIYIYIFFSVFKRRRKIKFTHTTR